MEIDPQAFIESVVEVTGQRDLDSFERSLVQTAMGLFHPIAINLYHRATGHGVDGLKLAFQSRQQEAPEAARVWLSLEDHPVLAPCVHLGIPKSYGESTGIHHFFPLENDQTVIGVLEIEGITLDQAQLQVLAGLLRVFHNMTSLLAIGERDTLTGLLNRRTFERNLRKVLEAQRGSMIENRAENRRERRSPCDDWTPWLAMLDLDHFKRINDQFGHAFGDEVLLLFARLLNEHFRSNDLIFRFGGEEFVVILEPIPIEDAELVLGRFLRALEAFKFPGIGKVTCSIGFTAIFSQEPFPRLLDKADQALYYAKGHGRNQLQCYETLLAAGLVEGPTESNDVSIFSAPLPGASSGVEVGR